MRSVRPLLLLITPLLAANCALLMRPYRPPHAPKSEAEKVRFPWGTPREQVLLSGIWLRAVTMALDDFLPGEEAEKARGEGEEEACLARRDNYVVQAWTWSPKGPSDAGSESPDVDGGMRAEIETEPRTDAGHETDAGYLANYEGAFDQPGMPKAPAIIYVTVFLLPGRCDLGGSPLMDMGATYAIDTVNWRILAIHH